MSITPAPRLALLMTLAVAACGPKSKDKSVEEVIPSEIEKAPSAAETMVANLAGLHIDKLGNPVLRWDHIPPVLAAKERPHKLLVLLVEYQDQKFDRFAGDKARAQKLKSFYQEQLFDPEYSRANTLSHYYKTQSLGAYHVTGEVLEPITLPQSRRYYGSPHRPEGGNWRNDALPEQLVADALAVAKARFENMNWSDFDRWDPQDYDGDKKLDEGDGYLDHFVVVFAGGGQSSCEGLYKVGDVLTPNVQMSEGIGLLSKAQRECADRIWPHRSKAKANDGQGPKLGAIENPGGGIPVSDTLWIRDYNMQSEYTGASTFIHEFGHSIGLPDVYSRTSSNSTGSWEVMSGTASPSPQNLSSWSRLMLGWLEPEVIVPPKFGGEKATTITLQTLDDAADADDATRAAMIILPPKEKHIELTELPKESGAWALYSGQGNELDRKAMLQLDLRQATGAIELSFDAWWEIEPGWDFAYLELSADAGKSWQRALPLDKAHMPAKHGHDGKSSLPGFTGLSGDLDGDGKNESQRECDPKLELPHGEDKDAANLSPCLKPSWVKPRFDLSAYAGKELRVRLRYYTDGAAVMRGMLIDNVSVSGQPLQGDFESEELGAWTLDGFSRSSGSHDLLVPHFYLVEHRDPYAKTEEGHYRYDAALADASTLFYADPTSEEMMAVRVKSRPGVVLWYYNGAYAWSENDPSINGPGQGYLLVVDGNTSELAMPGLESYYSGDAAKNTTHYDLKAEDAQKALESAYARTVCFVRNPAYLPQTGLSAKARKALKCGKKPAAVGAIEVDGRPLQYSYQVYNELLPGAAREAVGRTGELLDTRVKKGEVSYRLRDRSLRSLHTKDAPFSAESFADAIEFFKVGKKGLESVSKAAFPAQKSFSDSDPARYLNAKLPFGGAAIPSAGLSLEVDAARLNETGETRVDVQVRWQ